MRPSLSSPAALTFACAQGQVVETGKELAAEWQAVLEVLLACLGKSPKLLDHAALRAAAHLEGELPAKTCVGWF